MLSRLRAHGCCTNAGASVSSENPLMLPLPCLLGHSASVSTPLSDAPRGAPNMIVEPWQFHSQERDCRVGVAAADWHDCHVALEIVSTIHCQL